MEPPLAGKKILLGVTGGIAAYKAVVLLRLLKTGGADVKVVMTEAACEFVAPLTFETLSGHPVSIRMFRSGPDTASHSPVQHIDLAKWPDAIVVAPTTANTLSKLVVGAADDLLTTIVCAFDGPVILAPAMNDVMWRNAATRDNLGQLGQRGYRVIPPGSGDLACGYEAEGRMAEPEVIAGFVERLFGSEFARLRVLVSAGATEEDIDPARVITNRSSGKMGFAMAEAARDRGARVTVVMGRVSAAPPAGVRLIRVRTSAEMSQALKKEFVDSDLLVMTAAVADFKPGAPLRHKKKADKWSLALDRTEDILASLGEMKGKRFVIGFAVETADGHANARDKLLKKKCDLLVVNNPLREGAAFDHDTNVVDIINRDGKVDSTPLMSKREIADIILDAACREPAFRNILV